eukprot:1161877-Pelagomonas_calceolata.AAC.5
MPVVSAWVSSLFKQIRSRYKQQTRVHQTQQACLHQPGILAGSGTPEAAFVPSEQGDATSSSCPILTAILQQATLPSVAQEHCKKDFGHR